jgi:two-component system response regulator ChvI
MPRLDGLELCRKVRARSETIPIIFLTSKDEEIDRIVGLEIGADDYLCKPFSMRELCTRIKVIFRRASFYNEALRDGSLRDAAGAITGLEPAVTGPLILDPERLTVSWMGNPVRLTVTEFRILASLAENPGTVKNRDQLLTAAYPEDLYVSDRSVDSHIKRIRKKIQQADPDFSCIESIYGLGYKFAVQE